MAFDTGQKVLDDVDFIVGRLLGAALDSSPESISALASGSAVACSQQTPCGAARPLEPLPSCKWWMPAPACLDTSTPSTLELGELVGSVGPAYAPWPALEVGLEPGARVCLHSCGPRSGQFGRLLKALPLMSDYGDVPSWHMLLDAGGHVVAEERHLRLADLPRPEGAVRHHHASEAAE